MFQSRGGALAFVGITLISVAMLVGTDESDGALAGATAQFEDQRAEFRERVEEINGEVASAQANVAQPGPVDQTPSSEPVELEFTPDEDLIVDPTGFDPTPIIPDPTAAEIIIVEPGEEQ